MEEQSITTKEIARNIAQTSTAAETVAKGVAESASVTKEIAKNITEVSWRPSKPPRRDGRSDRRR